MQKKNENTQHIVITVFSQPQDAPRF